MLSSTFRAFRHRDYSIFWFGLLLGHTGLGPMGGFPFGLIASGIGASATVAACGLLTIVLVGYVAFCRPALRQARLEGRIATRRQR